MLYFMRKHEQSPFLFCFNPLWPKGLEPKKLFN